MNIEKALRNYLKGNGPKVKEKDFFSCAVGNGNAVFNVLFNLASEELDSITESKALDRVVEMLKLGEILFHNDDGLNRKLIARKIIKLQQKMDRILLEGKNKFVNINKIRSEFNKVNRQLDRMMELNEEKDTKQYDLMSFLIEDIKNIAYLEYTLKKMPSLANVRDKDEVSLFQNIVCSYLHSVEDEEEDNRMYYENLISLLLSQKSFHLSEMERRQILELVYKFLNQLSYNKKQFKKNKGKVERINQFIDKLKGLNCESRDIEEIAGKYRIHVFFQPSLLEELQLIQSPKEGEMQDRTFVEDYVVSIDGEDAVEIDDALSCKRLENGNYLLGVHIASVLGYFPYESPIVQEAIYRNQSIYLSHVYQYKDHDFHRTIPMFPYDFSADKGSLTENEKRLTRSYYFEITPEGDIVHEDFLRTIVQNNKRLTYNDANRILESGSDDKQLETTIRLLEEVTSVLATRYQGSELYETVKANTRDYSELRVTKVGSENIVYQAMMLTGNRVAEFFARNQYPCLYRVHEVNEDNNRKLQAMIDTLNQTYGGEQFKNLYQLIEGIYPRGWYAMEGRHSGLNVDHYCHCTSLLRRAADIVVEHALEVCYDRTPSEEDLMKLRKEIADKVVEINAGQSPIDYFVQEYQKKYRRK